MRNARWMMVRSLLLALMMLAGASAGARAANIPVLGSVVEPNSAQGAVGVLPAEGVTVTVVGTSLSDTTDARGAFQFKAVPEGEITLMAFKPGFQPTIKKVTLRGPMPGQVLLYLLPGGSVNMGGQEHIVKADTVYVAFSAPVPTGSNGSTVNSPLSGSATTSISYMGAVANGADPFTFGGNVPNMPTGPNQFSTNVSVAPNQLMVLDPEKPQQTDYVESASRLFWLAFSASGNKLFAASDQNVINVFDTSKNNILLQQIPAGGVVNDLVRSGNFVYASIMRANGDGIMVIDPSRNAPTRILPVPPLPTGGIAHAWSVAASSYGSRIYAAIGNERDGEVAAIDFITTHPVAVTRVGANPMGIALTPDNRYVLVANSKAATVTVLDAATLQPVANIPVGITPFHIAVRPDSTKAYVTCRGSNAVHVIHLSTLQPGPVIPVGTNPMGIAVTGTGNHVYVANQGSATVSIIDGDTDTFLRNTTPLPRSRPYGIAVKP